MRTYTTANSQNKTGKVKKARTAKRMKGIFPIKRFYAVGIFSDGFSPALFTTNVLDCYH